ncbi:zinc finger protein 512B isoform X5 [Physeter macrocephalus]|uniref:Zinc finger protein 512B isoform X5 n=1 Tax=Physeter macrocephalus TaxID=9755 RepID=A0A9W2X3Y1_PHYMC|nr:zinc finger protein 512B isoform X5 [Physeter catodon]|eukprot:XP_028354525.1 zinc finger protein 512B isoform X5 [Physeter catodon]
MTDPFCVGGGRRLPGSSKSGPGKDGGRNEVRLPMLHDPPKLGLPAVRGGQTVPSQAPLCFDPGSPASDRTEGKKKGRPKAENQALRDIPLSLMNQWKDEFKAHSRVKCPNAGCWLEFPSIYGLKYHYQRCQGGAISERLTFPCPFCEAAFTSKTQLEKHRIWNHMDRPLPAPKPGPVSRPVTVSRPVGVSKPIGVSKPVTISKPIGISKPVTVSRPVPVTKPVTASRPVPVTKPVTASRPVPVTKAVPVTRPVPVNKPIPVTKSVSIAKPVTVNKPVPVTKPVTINKPVSVTKLVTVTKPVPVAKPVTVSRPIVVSKPVTASRPIAISRHTPPCKMVLLAKSENKAPRAAGKSSGKKRAADGLDACPLPPKQARPENGEYGPSTTDQSSAFQLSTDPSSSPLPLGSRPLGGKEAPRAAGPVSPPEEGAERTKHRRKQKTPKKFTGEQPSISGTFGLKGEAWTSRAPVGPSTRGGRALSLHLPLPRVRVGLAKAEDKARIHRAKKQEGPVPEEARKRGPAPTSAVSKEVPAPGAHPAPGGLEERWQRAIHERGEAVCPTCNVVTRKTLMGLKKHMEVCQKLQDALKCQHCRKQFKSKAGLNYHTMAEHSAKASDAEASAGSEQEERERLRKVLKQMGRLRCPQEGCGAAFASLMGYQYHQRRCGKPPCEVETPSFPCTHCGKTYRSKAGHDYHVRSEHAAPPPEEPADKAPEAEDLLGVERTPSGRIRRTSAQVAVFHLQEIAEDELARDWTKRRMKDDLVPETGRLNYTRPGLPVLNPQLLEEWKNEVKEKGHVNCPNDCCEAIYSSVSGLKAHLASCSKNWFRTSADPPPRHKGPDSLVPRKEKSPAGGKKRGRKPKERPPEDPAPGTPPHRDDWPPGGRDKGARGSAGRKVGAGKAPENSCPPPVPGEEGLQSGLSSPHPALGRQFPGGLWGRGAVLPVSGFFLQPQCSDPGQSWPDVLGRGCGDVDSPHSHAPDLIGGGGLGRCR